MLIRPAALLLIVAVPRVAVAQPAASLPPKPANYDVVSAYDGNPAPTANDSAKFGNDLTQAHQWYVETNARRPVNVTGLSVSVVTDDAGLSWANPPGPATSRYVTRDGVLIATLPGTATVFADPDVPPGSHRWEVHTRNIVLSGAWAGVYAPTASAPFVTATIQGSTPPPSGAGWTDLTPPAGANVVYVTPTGTGTACSESNPCALSTGLTRVRPGQPDYLLFQGTFNNLAQIDIRGPWTISSYGTGATLNFALTGFHNDGNKNVRIAHLTIVGRNAIDTSGIISVWDADNLLVEGCTIRAFRDNLVVHHDTGAEHVTGVKIRRNVIADASHAGGNRAQGAYFKYCDGLLIEENYFINNGVRGSTQSHNLYVDEECGPATVRGNVFARSAADDQVRPGGTVENNTYLQNPIACWIGGTSTVRLNVVLESGDINPTDTRGIGLQVDGSATVASDNVICYNTGTGWGSVKGLWMTGGGRAERNFIYDWSRTSGQGDVRQARAIHCSGPSALVNNRVFMPKPGAVVEAEGNPPPTLSGSGNVYSGVSGYGPFLPSQPPGWTPGTQADPMLRQKLPGGSIDAYLSQCRAQKRAGWKDNLMAAKVNETMRQATGIGANP